MPDKNVYELKLELDAHTSGSLYLFSNEKNTKGLKLSFDAEHDTISMDRSMAGITFGESYGYITTATLKKQDKLTLQFFVDESVCEAFVYDSYVDMHSRVFVENQEE